MAHRPLRAVIFMGSTRAKRVGDRRLRLPAAAEEVHVRQRGCGASEGRSQAEGAP